MMAGGELDIATSYDVAILSSYRKGRTELALPTYIVMCRFLTKSVFRACL
jgi:hypothetical protein